MRHLRRKSRPSDMVGIGRTVLAKVTTPVKGEEALVQAPRQWAPKPVRPPIAPRQ